MATVSVTIPDAQLARVITALRAAYGITAATPDAAVVNMALGKFLIATVANVEQQAAQVAALAALAPPPPITPT